jgi:very-short-patch-repair endonuclease
MTTFFSAIYATIKNAASKSKRIFWLDDGKSLMTALKERARELRLKIGFADKNATVSERILWQAVRGKRLGVEFHRQVPVDKSIVDFYCHELMLAIEIDGVTHGSEETREKDVARQASLESLGVSFLRFYDGDVKENLQGVLTETDIGV